MKKVRLLLSLLAAFIGLSGYAEKIQTTPIQDGSAITEGYYAIRLNKKTGAATDRFNYIYTSGSQVQWKKIATADVDENYIWKLSSTGEGTFSLKHIATQTYISAKGAPSSSGGLSVVQSATPNNNFKIKYLGKSEDAENAGEHQYQITDGNIILHCEYSGNNEGNGVSYPGELNTASGWCFEKIDAAKGKALDQQFTEQTSLITITKTDDKGVVFSSFIKSWKKGEEFTFEKDLIAYTFNSVSLDGTVTDAASFTPTGNQHTVEYKYTYKMPFISNDINGSFPKGTHWYLLKIRGNKFVKYDAANATQVPADGQKGFGDEFWWTFSGDYANGIKIYNKAAGPNKVLTAENSGKPFVGELKEGRNEKWTLYPTDLFADANGFFLSQSGKTDKINDVGGSGILDFWSGADQGSTFTLVSIENELAPFSNYAPENLFAVGTLKEEHRNTFQQNFEAKTPEGLRAIIELAKAENYISLTDNGYYRLLSFARNNSQYSMTAEGDHKLYGKESKNNNASQIWKFVPAGENSYKLTAQNIYIKDATQSTHTESGNASEAQVYKVSPSGSTAASAALYTFRGSNQELHLDAALKIVGWNHTSGDRSDASTWMIVPAEVIEVEVSEAGYATANFPFAVKVSNDVTAYTGIVDKEKKELSLNKIASGIVPANTPVILKADKGTYALNIVDSEDTAPAGNDLEGTLFGQTIDKAVNAYILGNVEGKVGFYQMSDGDRAIAGNKAYLVLPEMSQIRSIIIGGPTTGIEDTVAEGAEAEEYYDLQGRRVMNPTKGIYVTKSGKKVVFNK